VRDAREALDNIVGSDRNTVRLSADTLRGDYLNPLQQAVNDAKDPRVVEALVNAKNILINKSRNAKLSADELQTLKDIDSRYFDLMRLKESGEANLTGVNIGKLSQSYQNAPGMDIMGATNKTNDELIGPAVRVLGATPRQDEARTMLNITKRILQGSAAASLGTVAPVTTAVSAPLYGLSAMGQTPWGARALTGQNPTQKALKEALESNATNEVSLANLLRALRDNSSTLGASLTTGQ
jgi:hypothetical protein